ncbi:protocatechuate 3,4-dioxygenase beta subunit [Arthrobacter silviterrae]|uniref:hypothetical protein n=1 Tax=Arthrobacter silviterrae TaxID=2026658 RepID=UPI002783AD80|nr:hypothetical protein [Arthrobacter silviterrae]MDQ0279330.1 protocatechuate 3,4-dioxygenase beta subunit [Arthrobacter silviterrae]
MKAGATSAQATLAPACLPATAQPTNGFPGTTVLADNFESGTLSQWKVWAAGTGTAAVVTNAHVTGACSARLHEDALAGSLSNLTKAIPAGLGDVYADGYFDVATAGVTGAANSYLRFYIGTTRVASVYRNVNDGNLYLETLSSAGTWTRTRLTSTAVSMWRWHHIQMHVLPNGAATTVQVWLDGTSVYSNSHVNGRTGNISSVSTGNEFTIQRGDLYLDNLIIKAQALVAPAPACLPATAQPTNSFPGTTVLADNFESGTLSQWKVWAAGTGTAAVVTNAHVTGACSARLHEDALAGSLSNLTKAIPAGLGDVYADGYFDVATAGVTGAANSYLRFYIGTTRVASVYRNVNDGSLYLETLSSAGTWTRTRLTSTAVSMWRWHHIQMHVLPNGAATTVQVWLDGTSVYSNSHVNGRTGNISSVSTGNEFTIQRGDLYLDNLIIKAQPTPPPTCQPLTAAPSTTFPGTTVVADNFESGVLSNWAVNTGGDGTAAVVNTAAVTGACSTHLHASTAAGSIATLTKTIPAGLGDVYADGSLDVAGLSTQGGANSYFRFYSGTTRVAAIYRNVADGSLWLETLSPTNVWTRTKLTGTPVSLWRWHHLQMHVLPNGAATTVQVWLDGTSVFSSSTVNGRIGDITSVATGNEFAGQQGDLYLDNVIIKAQPVANCAAAVLPTNSFPGTTVVADNFECGNLNKWTLQLGGDATATVQQTTVHTGLSAASLVTTTNNLSRANLSHAIPAASTDVYADGWFNITAIGPVGNDVPYFRFWTGSTRFADIYRYNSTGQLWLRVLSPAGTDIYAQLTTSSISLSAWHHVQMRVAAAGPTTTIQVWLDGVQVYNSAAVNTSATSTTSVMMGSEHYPQPASINIDDVIIKAVP